MVRKEFKMEPKELLMQGLEKLNIKFDEETLVQLLKFKEIVIEKNKYLNLTAIEDDTDFIIKHFIDSLSVVPFIENKSVSLIDVGTGAGFPGIPLKIMMKNLHVTLLDSLEKRVKFLDEAIVQLSLDSINTTHNRAEDAGNNNDFREKYDFAVSRAVAILPVLLEYCMPFVKVGATFLAMKSNVEEELSNSRKALKILGGEIVDVKRFDLPFTDNKRNIIIVKKIRQTPTNYPRKAGKPSKSPL